MDAYKMYHFKHLKVYSVVALISVYNIVHQSLPPTLLSTGPPAGTELLLVSVGLSVVNVSYTCKCTRACICVGVCGWVGGCLPVRLCLWLLSLSIMFSRFKVYVEACVAVSFLFL